MKNKNGRRRPSKPARDEAAANGDRLSELPDDLLLNILERVDTLDAIRTCILSKRLQKFPTMLSNLFVSAASVLRHHNLAVREFGIRDMLRISRVVADVTDNILSTRSPEITISKLKIRFVLTDHDTVAIGKSVARAMATQKVDSAEFEIITEKAKCSPDELLHFARQFKAFLGACPDAFAGLTRLWLCNLRFDDELGIPDILSTCKRLESLHLNHCDSGIHSVLQLEHAQLVELHVDSGRFERIELTCLPKLQRVSYNHWFCYGDPIYFGFVPQLSKLSIAKTGVKWEKTLELSHILANAPSICDLHLDFECEKIWVLPERPKLLTPVFSKLQQVNLENLPEGCDISWTIFVLEAAPSLKELCITVWNHWCIMLTNKELRKKRAYCEKTEMEWKPCAPDLKHKNLVKLTIYGFQPDDNFAQYIRRVAEVAVNMAEISLHDRKVCGRCGGLDPKSNVCPSRYPRTADERKQTTEELGLASPSVVHFRS